jgi:hypothetical protein
MDDIPLITTIAVGFTGAWLLGLLTQRFHLSPIVGYLLAGVVIGPHTPGFVGDLHLAHQLAEVGVILLMFGVGLHFQLADLLAVKSIAIPGAVGQSLVATLASIGVFMLFGIEPRTGAVIGMAMAVASTVVLMRVLMDAEALDSPAGHVAVGWLLVEDVLTAIQDSSQHHDPVDPRAALVARRRSRGCPPATWSATLFALARDRPRRQPSHRLPAGQGSRPVGRARRRLEPADPPSGHRPSER